MQWLDKLGTFDSAGAMRAWLRSRNPALDPAKLKKIAIVGAADEGLRLVELAGKRGIQVLAIGDDATSRQGMALGGVKVGPVDGLGRLDHDTPVIIASHRVLKAQKRLEDMGFKHVAPFALLEVLDPEGFPPHMFYDGWLEDLARNREKYTRLASLFADDMSRKVLDAVLGFRLTLDPHELEHVVEWDLYGPNALIKYGTDEVYVDGGAFDGDTIKLFIERVKGKFSRVIAFEPDKGTFARLKGNFEGEERVQPINAGLHRKKATLKFDNAGTRGSILTDTGTIEVPVVGLDEVLGEDRVTYIKMNIEGAELEALRGGEKAIKRCAPKLAISAYHRPTDLWEVADVISSIRPDYKLYLRQHDGGVIETVVYALAQ